MSKRWTAEEDELLREPWRGAGAAVQVQGRCSVSAYPCLDPETHRYRSYPGMCAACTAPVCWMGSKPKPVRERLNPMIAALRAGQPVPEPVCPDCGLPNRTTSAQFDESHRACRRHRCDHCGELFAGYGKAKYCRDECRTSALRKRRMIRRRGTIVPMQRVVWRTCVCGVCGGEFKAQGPAIRCRGCREAARSEYNKRRYAEKRAVGT